MGSWILLSEIVMKSIKRFHLKGLSLRIEVFLLVFIVGVLPAMLITSGVLSLYASRSVRSDVTNITNEATLLANQIVTSGYLSDTTQDSMNTRFMSIGNAYDGRVMVIDADLKVVKDTYGADEGRTIVWSSVLNSLSGVSGSYYDQENSCITVTVPITTYTEEDEQEVVGVLLLTKSTDYITQNTIFFKDVVLEIMLIIGVASSVLGIIMARRFTEPLHRISKSIEDVQNGVVDEVSVKDFSETREISKKFNGFADQMRAVDDSRQEFVSNVSHELKTPLTSMKVLADSLNGMEDAPVELYKEFMQDIGNEIDRETKIINDLLSLVKLDKSGAALNISPVNVNDLMEVLLKRLKPIAEKQKVELVLESFRPVTAEVDEVKFSLAIMNLVENGIKYNEEGGYVHVSVNSDHQYLFIRVKDSGMGIPEDSLEHIFDRFYRVDKSHSREIGGTGLGLAITKNCILMHHGEIKVHSILGQGTTFDVRVPLSYIEKEA